jgi:hypothetical protein
MKSETIMTNTTTLTVRSAALAGATFVALTLLPTIVTAQAPRPDFPGAKQGDSQQPNAEQTPRPDFPGAKQGEVDAGKSPRPDFPGPKQSDSQPQK